MALLHPYIGRHMKTFAKNIFSVLLMAFLAGLCLFMLASRCISNNALPMPFGVGCAVVMSGSMQPALNVDDLVFVTRAADVQVGDVVVYQQGDALVIHRVVALDGASVTTQGDANNIPDAPVALDSVKGKLVGRIAGAGALVRAAQTPAVAGAVVAAVVLIFGARARGRTTKRQRELAALKDEINAQKTQNSMPESEVSDAA